MKKPSPEERTLTTAARGMNELVIVPATTRVPPDEFRVFVRVDEPENEERIEGVTVSGFDTIEHGIEMLYEKLGADETSRILVTPDDKGWTIAELPKDRDEGVLVSDAYADDELDAVARLYRAIGGEPHPEDDERKLVEELLANDELRAIVLPTVSPSPPSSARRTPSVKDLVGALFSIADALADMHGDPGRTVDLPTRARAIREASDRARRTR